MIVEVTMPGTATWRIEAPEEAKLALLGGVDCATQWLRDAIMGNGDITVKDNSPQNHEEAKEDTTAQDTESVERQPTPPYDLEQEMSKGDAAKVYYEAINLLRKRLDTVNQADDRATFKIPVQNLLSL